MVVLQLLLIGVVLLIPTVLVNLVVRAIIKNDTILQRIIITTVIAIIFEIFINQGAPINTFVGWLFTFLVFAIRRPKRELFS